MARLGAKVTVVEFLERIGGPLDGEVAKQFQRSLENRAWPSARHESDQGRRQRQGRNAQRRASQRRRKEHWKPTWCWYPSGGGLILTGWGWTKPAWRWMSAGASRVDNHFETNVKGIYAIGDVIAGPMLAHKAEDEGMAAAEIMAGQKGHVTYDAIPSVIYTWPEVASVGNRKKKRKRRASPIKSGKSPSWPIAAPAPSRNRGLPSKSSPTLHLTASSASTSSAPMPEP